MWMLMMLLHSPVIPDALKPVQTYYASQMECEAALKAEATQGHNNGECYPVTWK